MRILICPDSFKGTLTAPEAASVMEREVLKAMPGAETVKMPLGDGGEGTMDALASAMQRIEWIECETVDALRRPVTARYAVAGGDTALIESAAAGGLTLIDPRERDIMKADSYGTGLLIADALGRGLRRLILGMGGTAMCDGGYGAFLALKDKGFPPEKGLCRELDISLLCDVTNPLCGADGAAAVFGPQKGAAPRQIPLLDKRLQELADFYRGINGIDTAALPYAGAAGGLAAMLTACYGARPKSGINEVLRLLDFDSALEGADLVITGEGRGDATTLSGKTPKGVLDAARRRGVPVALVCGQISDRDLLLCAGFSFVEAHGSRHSATTPSTVSPTACSVWREMLSMMSEAVCHTGSNP